jgi:SAM-dependent methyltransferase
MTTATTITPDAVGPRESTDSCCSPSCCGGRPAAAGAEAGQAVSSGREARIQEAVRRRYAEAARAATAGRDVDCGCGCGEEATAVFGRSLYGEADAAPEGALRASLGCANPHALVDLAPGQVVLDLGSGGGIDVFLAARRVGPTGRVYGLDMTDEMLDLARANQAEAGVTNAEFLKGRMEEVPLPEASVDVVMSNCVVNLSPDKDRVLAEAFRVLRPGGRFAVADVVTLRPMPQALAERVELWSECLGGALEVDDYRARLAAAGFADAEVEVLKTYGLEEAGVDADRLLAEMGLAPAEVENLFASALVRATKPAAG